MDPFPLPSQILVLTVFCYVFPSSSQQLKDLKIQVSNGSPSSRSLPSGACRTAPVQLVARKDCEKMAVLFQEEELVVCISRPASRLPVASTWKKRTEVGITAPELLLWWALTQQRCKEVPSFRSTDFISDKRSSRWSGFDRPLDEVLLPLASGKRSHRHLESSTSPFCRTAATRPFCIHRDVLAAIIQKRRYGESASWQGRQGEPTGLYAALCLQRW